MNTPSVGIVGGGILGLTAAYRLARAGVRVTLYERSPDLGGLVGGFDFGGRRVDRFYHVILPTDDRVLGLGEELGLGGRFRFRPTSVGFYDDGRLFSIDSLGEFLRFPLLAPHDRMRLATFLVRCQLTSDHARLDRTPLEEWLTRLCGRRTFERMWRPLLDAKFDGQFGDLPATYLWARTKRMSKTRDRSGREVMGWLEGGYDTLIAELARAVRGMGGTIHAGRGVDAVMFERGGVTGLVVDGSPSRFDQVLCTLVPPQARRLFPRAVHSRLPVDRCRYLGVVCVLMRTTRSISPYYTLNITDRRIPLTTVVETTHVVDPAHVGGHLLYAARYVDPSHHDLERSVEDVRSDYVRHVRTIFPDLDPRAILDTTVQRARIVEPVHTLAGAGEARDMFPVPGLALASTADVYPENVNGQAVIGIADRAAEGLLERRPIALKAAA